MEVKVNARIEKIVFKGDEAQAIILLGKIHGQKLLSLSSQSVEMIVDDRQPGLPFDEEDVNEGEIQMEIIPAADDALEPIVAEVQYDDEGNIIEVRPEGFENEQPATTDEAFLPADAEQAGRDFLDGVTDVAPDPIPLEDGEGIPDEDVVKVD